MILKRERYIRSIAQRTVGQLGRLFTTSVHTVENKLRRLRVLIKSIVIGSVGVRVIDMEQKKKQMRGRAKRQVILQFISG